MLQILKKFAFSTKSINSADFKSILSRYKEEIYQLSLPIGNGIASLEKMSVKVANSKTEAPLREIGTINLIDPQKAELTTFDPQLTKSVMSSLQSAGLNLTISALSASKLLIIFPKPTTSSKTAIVDQLKKRTEQFKNELRDIRRKEINDFRLSTKNKDEIRNFELQTQKKFDSVISELEKELDISLKLIRQK